MALYLHVSIAAPQGYDLDTESLTWDAAFSSIIAVGVYTIIFYFTCPETTYRRPKVYDIDIREELSDDMSLGGSGNEVLSEKFTGQVQTAPGPGSDHTAEAAQATSHEARQSYREGLKVYNGRYSDESFLRALITPWSAFLLPAVSYTAFAYGSSVAFAGSFSVAIGQIFTKPPYNFTSSQVGMTTLSSLVGATLGNLIPGPVADWSVNYLSRKNNGVYEPEFRLVLAVPALFLGLLGFWGFGLSLDAKAHYMVPIFFYGLAIFAGSINSLISNTYLLDCHRAQAQDGYAAVTITRGVYSFATTFIINGWIDRDGYKIVYFWIGFLHALSCVMAILLYIFGKQASTTFPLSISPLV